MTPAFTIGTLQSPPLTCAPWKAGLMQLKQRIVNYSAIENVRQRPLIVYCTSTRTGVQSHMASDAVREFIDQLDAIPECEKSIDILIHSTGGDALAAWKLMSVLRERFETVAVLVPYMAFSAATIFALGADEIVMHPHASLGPIDPQITIALPGGDKRRFSFEDLGAFLRFIREEVEITEQTFLSGITERLLTVVDPVNVGFAKRSSELATDVGERLLQMHMTSSEDRARARAIAEGLNKSFFAHGDAVSRSRGRELHLKIADSNPELESHLWQAYLGIEGHMELRKPFNPLHHFIANGGQASIAPTAPVNLPPNAPPQLLQQIWGQVAQDAMQKATGAATEVDFELVNAIIESPRLASENRSKGKLTGYRVPGGEIKLVGTDSDASWRSIQI